MDFQRNFTAIYLPLTCTSISVAGELEIFDVMLCEILPFGSVMVKLNLSKTAIVNFMVVNQFMRIDLVIKYLFGLEFQRNH